MNPRKKPDFLRQDSHKKKKLGAKWRKPKGLHSKMRLCKKGYRKMPSVGYGSPKSKRFLDSSGLMPVMVESSAALEKIDKSTHAIIISGSIGLKKKIELLKLASSLGIKVINIKDSEKFIKDSLDKIEQRKQERKKTKKKKEQKKKSQEKKEKPKTIDEKIEKTEEERKDEEKKERDRLLTKRTQ